MSEKRMSVKEFQERFKSGEFDGEDVKTQIKGEGENVLLVFELTMPNVGSWNGRWTSEDKYHAKVVNFKAKELAENILSKGSFYYDFKDGWGMNISVRKVDSKEAAKIRRKSVGFCGYEWAIDSILQYQKIIS